MGKPLISNHVFVEDTFFIDKQEASKITELLLLGKQIEDTEHLSTGPHYILQSGQIVNRVDSLLDGRGWCAYYKEFIGISIGRDASSLTERKRRVYELYKENNNITYKQAGDELGISATGVYKHIIKLESLGYIKRDTRGGIKVL